MNGPTSGDDDAEETTPADEGHQDTPAADSDDGSGRERVPIRRGVVELRTRDGERIRHTDAYVQYHPDAFVVSDEPGFEPSSTQRYPKRSVTWLEVRHKDA